VRLIYFVAYRVLQFGVTKVYWFRESKFKVVTEEMVARDGEVADQPSVAHHVLGILRKSRLSFWLVAGISLSGTFCLSDQVCPTSTANESASSALNYRTLPELEA
jgi:hypothetical protein